MEASSVGVGRRVFLSGMGAFAGRVAAGRRAWGGVGPNERIVVGMIGVGTHGLDRLREFLRHADVRIGAVCDVDGRHRDRALREVKSAKGYRPKAVKDFRRVLDDPDIDAVAVVTPDHWHSIPTVRACEAGKDVFVEKPLGYSIADVAFWALDLAAPRTVSAVGGRFFVDDATETPDCLEVTMDFPGLTFLFTYHPKPLPGLERMGHIGCVFQGTEATLVTNYGTHEILVDGKPVPDFPRPDPTIPDSPGHLREFLDAVKSRDLETTCNLRYGHRLTKPALLANLAFRTGEKIRWDDDREEILGESSAKPLLTRVFRKPWSL